MITKTIDVVVREKLMDIGYPIHYYLPFLHHAIRCLEELSMDHDIGEAIKQEKLSINSYDRIAIPNTAIDIIGVFGLHGDEYKAFHYNNNLTKVYNLDVGSNKIPYQENETDLENYIKSPSSLSVKRTGQKEDITIYYPEDDYNYEYNVDIENGEIIIGNGHKLSEAYVVYLGGGVSVTSANVVHPYAVSCIHSYMEYMISRSDGSPQSKVVIKKGEYYNAKRLLRGRLNPMSYNEITQILNNS